MRLGFGLPHIGPAASPETLIAVAQRAEALGYESVWVTEHLLYPLEPKTPYPGSANGMLPDHYKIVLDPLETLTFDAAHTSRVALGTSTINIPYYNPVMLARRLTTLDVLSAGRLRVAFGIAWSEDECDVFDVLMRERGRRADEFLQVLKAIWTSDPVEFHGEFYHVPKSHIFPKPVQQPHPPIYMGAFERRAFPRIATLCNGWNPVFFPPEVMTEMFGTIKAMAEEAGRDPAELVVRANGRISDAPQGDDRPMFSGSAEQIAADVAAMRAIEPADLLFDPCQTTGVDTVEEIVSQMERFWELAQA